jgi:formylmethanofuran dehydrogenase subunit C
MPVPGDGRSGTFSATVTQYGGYQQGATPSQPVPVNRSRIVRQPTGPFLRVFALINDGGTGTTTNGSVTIPVTAVDGDVVIVHHHATAGAGADDFTTPTGWTRKSGPDVTTLTAVSQGWLWTTTVATGQTNRGPGDTVTFTLSTARRLSGTCTVWANVTEAGLTFATFIDSTIDVTADLPTLAGVTAGEMTVAVWGRRSTAATPVAVTVPSPWTAGPISATNDPSANLASRVAYQFATVDGSYGGEVGSTTPDNTTGVDSVVALPAAGSPPPATTASGTITLGGTADAAAAAPGTTGSITLAGTATGQAPVTAAGTITLGGTATATAPATAAGTITLGGTATARAAATAAGTVTLSGTATAQVPATASGTITLSGAPTARAAATAAGTVTLGGAPAAVAPATASGTVTLTGTASTGAAPTAATASGTISLTGTAAASSVVTSGGAIALSGTATGKAAAVPSGLITLGGAVTAAVPATVTGLITLSGLANAQAVGGLRDITVTYGRPAARRTATATATRRTSSTGVRTMDTDLDPDTRDLTAAGASRTLTTAARS